MVIRKGENKKDDKCKPFRKRRFKSQRKVCKRKRESWWVCLCGFVVYKNK